MTEDVDDERDIELSSIRAIFPELEIDTCNPHAASLDVDVSPSSSLMICFAPVAPTTNGLSNGVSNDVSNGGTPIPETSRDTYSLSHLPPLHLHIDLPKGYPDKEPPLVELSAYPAWVPASIIQQLTAQCRSLWEEYGCSQVLFGYIDYLQQEADRAFDMANDPGWRLPHALKNPLLDYDRKVQRLKFNQATYDCGVCLEPKKGSACYRLRRCGHVFCVNCLQDFYNSAISEGDINSVKCLTPDCGKQGLTAAQKRTKKTPTLHPTELLDIPLDESQVKRYVDLKIKKKLESDNTTVYCPRKWCQGPAKSAKWARYSTAHFSRSNLAEFPDSDTEDAGEVAPGEPARPLMVPNSNASTTHPSALATRAPPPDRLSICSTCAFAFCRLCQRSWHGEHVNCIPQISAELSAEEKASYDYMRMYTSPCPTCSAPCQKTHGCNHMRCFQCNSHFCYLCSAWLHPGDPYKHFNTRGSECYMRLWELEEGDEGPQNRPDQEAHWGGARGAEINHAAEEAVADDHAAAALAAQIEELRFAGEEGGGLDRDAQVRFMQWMRRRGVVDEMIDAM